jgi:hypothetical protein
MATAPRRTALSRLSADHERESELGFEGDAGGVERYRPSRTFAMAGPSSCSTGDVSRHRGEGHPRIRRWMIQDCRRPFSSLTDIHEELGRLRLEIDELRSRLACEG